MSEEGKWIVVHAEASAVGRIAVNLRHVMSVREKSGSRFGVIDFDDGTTLVTQESFDEIGEKIQ